MEDERCHWRANRVGTDGYTCADSRACLPDAYSMAGWSVRCYFGLRQSRIRNSHAKTVEPGWDLETGVYRAEGASQDSPLKGVALGYLNPAFGAYARFTSRTPRHYLRPRW